MTDVIARLQEIAETQGKRLVKLLGELGKAAAPLASAAAAAAGTAAESAWRALSSALGKIDLKTISPFAWSLIASGAAGAIAAFIVALSVLSLDDSGSRIARTDQAVAALNRRLDAIERTDTEAFATSHAALTALANRVAAAETAITKSAALAHPTPAEIQQAVSADLAGRISTSGEIKVLPADLTGLEQRVAALEAKAKQEAALAAEGSEHPADMNEGASAFPPFESSNFASELIWLALSFGLLYLLMSKIALPRVENILQTRAAKLTGDIGEANAFRKRAEEAAAAHEKTIADARAKAQALAQETHARLNAEADAKRHALESDLNAKLAAAEGQIVDTKAKAMANVESIANDAAAAIVERITGKPAEPKAIAAALAATKA